MYVSPNKQIQISRVARQLIFVVRIQGSWMHLIFLVCSNSTKVSFGTSTPWHVMMLHSYMWPFGTWCDRELYGVEHFTIKNNLVWNMCWTGNMFMSRIVHLLCLWYVFGKWGLLGQRSFQVDVDTSVAWSVVLEGVADNAKNPRMGPASKNHLAMVGSIYKPFLI